MALPLKSNSQQCSIQLQKDRTQTLQKACYVKARTVCHTAFLLDQIGESLEMCTQQPIVLIIESIFASYGLKNRLI